MLKYSHISIIIFIAALLGSMSSVFKTEDFPYKTECLLASLALQTFALATLVFKIIKQKGFKEQ